nr:hypothetical protein [Pseudomonas aeruginosa]
MKRKQSIESVRWDLALRYRLIETVAWWEGRLTTNHLMQSFGISRQQASKDINSYISKYAPKNLEYDKHLKGYVPSRHFKPLFIDDSGGASPRDRTRFEKFSALHNCHDIPTKEVRPMSLQCPRCHSPKVASFHHAMRIGAAIGTVGGVARGVSAALAGGQAGAAIGAFAGPVGITLGSVSGAILGGLAGGVGGCALGAQLGESLDRHVLAHNLCLLCGHRFNLPA